MKWLDLRNGLWLCLLLLVGCEVQDRVAGGSSDETRTTVTMLGRVVDERARGIEAVTVRLSQRAYEVVTDSNGAYGIPASVIDSAHPDTLLFFRDGQQVSSLPVQAKWTKIPDLILFQREIAGGLGCVDTMPTSATAFVVWSGREVDSVPLVLDPVQDRFSTFVWIGVTDTAEPFGVYVDFRDASGQPVSRSPVQRFERLPEEIVVDGFGCYNSRPILAPTMPDSAYRGDMVLVHSGAASTIGLPLTVEWRFGDDEEWVPGPIDTLVMVPSRHPTTTWQVFVRASDSRGISTTRKTRTGLKFRTPEMKLEVDSFVEINYDYPVRLRFQQNPYEEPMQCRLRYGIPDVRCFEEDGIDCDSLPDPLKRTQSDVTGPMRSQDGFWRPRETNWFMCSDTVVRVLASVVGLNRVKVEARRLLGYSASTSVENYLYPHKPTFSFSWDDFGGLAIFPGNYRIPFSEGEQSSYTSRVDIQWNLGGGWQGGNYLPGADSAFQNRHGQKLQVRGVTIVTGSVMSRVVYSDTAYSELEIPPRIETP